MKPFLSAVFSFCMVAAYGQSGTAQPVEEQHPISAWWWLLGVLIAIGAGVVIYLLIKKDPRRDSVR